MKRPEEHETDERGNAIFREVFAKWAVNGCEKDYGWDYAVEVFCNCISIGLLFKGQLKSSMVTAYSAAGSFISQRLEIDSAEYLATELKQPTFLFHADVPKKQLFWSAIQLDSAVLNAIEKGNTKSLTVRIPTSNLLPDCFDRFLEDLRKSHCVVVGREILAVSNTDFVDAMRGRPTEKMDGVAEDLHEKAFRVELQAAHEVFQKGDVAEATRRLETVLSSPTASLAIRFNATVQLGDVKWTGLMRSSQPQVLAAQQLLSTARELCTIADNGPQPFRLYALIVRTAAELGIINQKLLGLVMNFVGHKKAGDDPLWLVVLSFEVDQSIAAAGRKYKQALRLARTTAKSSYRWIAPLATVRIAREIAVLATILDSAELNQAALQYRNSAFQLFRMAAAVATENKDMDSLFQIVTNVLMLDDSETSEIYKWSRSIVEGWRPESEYRVRANEFTRHARQRRQGVKFATDIETTERQVHENLLVGFGIDPASQPWAGMIDIALRDGDLGRVLKGCGHTAVSAGGNPMLDRLGLQLAGRKTMHCTLHKWAVGGTDIDQINEAFTRQYCSSCKDKVPRDAEWRFGD